MNTKQIDPFHFYFSLDFFKILLRIDNFEAKLRQKTEGFQKRTMFWYIGELMQRAPVQGNPGQRQQKRIQARQWTRPVASGHR